MAITPKPDEWTLSDEAQSNFLPMKYQNREQLGEEYLDKRKIADKNRLREDGTPNPHFPRMMLEAELANVRYDMAYVIEQNRHLQEQVDILVGLFRRVDVLEGAYGNLRQTLDCATSQYKESMGKHYEDRREWSTRTGMQRAGLDPESKEDRLRWAQKLDALTVKFFTPTLDEEQK